MGIYAFQTKAVSSVTPASQTAQDAEITDLKNKVRDTVHTDLLSAIDQAFLDGNMTLADAQAIELDIKGRPQQSEVTGSWDDVAKVLRIADDVTGSESIHNLGAKVAGFTPSYLSAAELQAGIDTVKVANSVELAAEITRRFGTLFARLGITFDAADWGAAFTGDTVSDNAVTLLQIIQELETKVEAVELLGDLMAPGSATFAGLPAVTAIDANNWSVLTAPDGVNLPGIYVTDGTIWTLFLELSQPLAGVLADFAATNGDELEAKLWSADTLSKWLATFRPTYDASTAALDFDSLGVTNPGATVFWKTDATLANFVELHTTDSQGFATVGRYADGDVAVLAFVETHGSPTGVGIWKRFREGGTWSGWSRFNEDDWIQTKNSVGALTVIPGTNVELTAGKQITLSNPNSKTGGVIRVAPGEGSTWATVRDGVLAGVGYTVGDLPTDETTQEILFLVDEDTKHWSAKYYGADHDHDIYEEIILDGIWSSATAAGAGIGIVVTDKDGNDYQDDAFLWSSTLTQTSGTADNVPDLVNSVGTGSTTVGRNKIGLIRLSWNPDTSATPNGTSAIAITRSHANTGSHGPISGSIEFAGTNYKVAFTDSDAVPLTDWTTLAQSSTDQAAEWQPNKAYSIGDKFSWPEQDPADDSTGKWFNWSVTDDIVLNEFAIFDGTNFATVEAKLTRFGIENPEILLGRLSPVAKVVSHPSVIPNTEAAGSRILYLGFTTSSIYEYDNSGAFIGPVADPGAADWPTGVLVRDNATGDDYKYDRPTNLFTKAASDLEIVRYTADGAIQDKDHRAIFETGAVNMTLAASTTDRTIQMVSEGPLTIVTANGAEEFTNEFGTSVDQQLRINRTFSGVTIIGRTAAGWSQYDGLTTTQTEQKTVLITGTVGPGAAGTVNVPLTNSSMTLRDVAVKASNGASFSPPLDTDDATNRWWYDFDHTTGVISFNRFGAFTGGAYRILATYLP